jgi:hypothetical protein
VPAYTIDLKLLLISDDAGDASLAAIGDLLDRIGTPYEIAAGGREPLTDGRLYRGDHGYYQGVIVAANAPARRPAGDYGASHGILSDDERGALGRFEARFGIRQVICCGPAGVEDVDSGLVLTEEAGSATTPLPVMLTPAGRRVFWYLNPEGAVALQNARVGLARPGDRMTIPLLVTPWGDVVAAVHHSSDGREILTLTMSQGPGLIHTLLLGYGVLDWVTGGIYLGQRHVYLGLHVDDIFTGGRLWDPEQQAEASDVSFRLGGDDVEALVAWLDRLQAHEPNAAQIELDLAFNGGGAGKVAREDRLVQSFLPHQARFRWINHTFSHPLLNEAGYEDSLREIMRNTAFAGDLGLRRYAPDCIVTPGHSGLDNPHFLRAAQATGITYLAADTSHGRWANPSPNVGIVNAGWPRLLTIPRHPNNLFYNVSTPEEWAAEYNYRYHDHWGRDLAFDEIVALQSETILSYLLKFDIDPLMFHQANLRAFDGQHSLLSVLVDRVLARYNAVYGDVPICSWSMSEIGRSMARRAACDGAKVRAHLVGGHTVVLTADRDALVPLTGARAEVAESYAGQVISWVFVQAQTTARIPLATSVDFQRGQI